MNHDRHLDNQPCAVTTDVLPLSIRDLHGVHRERFGDSTEQLEEL